MQARLASDFAAYRLSILLHTRKVVLRPFAIFRCAPTKIPGYKRAPQWCTLRVISFIESSHQPRCHPRRRATNEGGLIHAIQISTPSGRGKDTMDRNRKRMLSIWVPQSSTLTVPPQRRTARRQHPSMGWGNRYFAMMKQSMRLPR